MKSSELGQSKSINHCHAQSFRSTVRFLTILLPIHLPGNDEYCVSRRSQITRCAREHGMTKQQPITWHGRQRNLSRPTRPVYGPGAVHQHNVLQSTLFKEENCGRSEVDSALSTTSWKHERRKQIRQRTVDNAIQQKIAGRMNSIWNYSYLLKRNIGPWGENQYSVTQIYCYGLSRCWVGRQPCSRPDLCHRCVDCDEPATSLHWLLLVEC